MGARCAIHTNTGLKHQVEWADALRSGFFKHGVHALITPSKTMQADINVCLGPWYALPMHTQGTVFYLDRAFWGDPERCSLQWMHSGYKQFDWRVKPERAHPELQPEKVGDRVVILCDYDMIPEPELKRHPKATIRKHPAQAQSEPLADCLNRHDIAAGRHTTALVDAAIHGLAIHCVTPYTATAGLMRGRKQWINCLAWHNWHIDEIRSGEAWEHLREGKRDYLSAT